MRTRSYSRRHNTRPPYELGIDNFRTTNRQRQNQYLELENMPLPDYLNHVYLPKRYRRTDITRRHRITDEENKDEDVRAYTRRPAH